MFIDWRNLDIITGHPIIDTQHIKIVELINEAYIVFLKIEDNTATFEFVSSIMAVKEYLYFHFEEEEKIMKSLNYPDMSNHMDTHNEVRSEIDILIERLMDEKNPNIKFLSKKLLLVLRDVLLHHIETSDKIFVKDCAKIIKDSLHK